MLDRSATSLAHALYRLWRLRRWQRRQTARLAEDARVSALYSLPAPKHPPPRIDQHHLSRAELPDGTPIEVVLMAARVPRVSARSDQKACLEEALRAALLPTGLSCTVVEDVTTDGFRVTLVRGKHRVTTLVDVRNATPATGFKVAKVLFDRLEDIAAKVPADTAVHVQQTPLPKS